MWWPKFGQEPSARCRNVSGNAVPTVDDVIGTCGVGGFIGCQIEREQSDLAGVTESVQRGVGDIEVKVGDHPGMDLTRQYRVDAYPVWCEIDSCRFRHPADRPLRGRIGKILAMPTIPAVEDTLMIEPDPAAFIPGITACIPRYGPI